MTPSPGMTVDWHRLLDPIGRGRVAAEASASEVAHRFDQSLRRVMSRRTPAFAGKIRVITLDHVRRALADTWRSIERVATDVAERVVHSLLREDDVCAVTPSGAFVIVFADCDDDEAVLRAVHISRRIEEEVTREFGVARLATDIRVAPIGPDQAKAGIDGIDAWLDAAEDLRTSGYWASADQGQLGDIAISFRPMLREQQRVFMGYQARVNRLTSDGKVLRGLEALGGIEAGSMRHRLDTALSRGALKVHAHALQRGAKTLLSLPIAFDSLSGSAGDRLLSQLASLPAEQRQLVIVDLVSTPDGRPPDQQMWRALKVLSSQFRLVSVQTNGSTSAVDGYLPHGVGAFSIDLDDASGYRLQTLTTPRLTSELSGFAARLRARKLVTLLYGLDTKPLVEAGLAARFTYLSGGAIARDTRRLAAPVSAV